ncbi:MAG TPA: hypothetical protein VLD13_11570 [Gaiellaceae bacterium]|nr:hypothetical protein [Gaiellaceae bacterium]
MERLSAPRWVDEQEWSFGWISPERPRLRLASHALLAGGGVWVVDPTDGDGVEERIRALGEPAGVIQLLDRHRRACAGLARRLAVPHHVVPYSGVGPFEAIPVVRRSRWQEAALWWPERRVLVCAEALGTVPHVFALRGEPLGVHPLLRLVPPRRLAEVEPEHVLCGHGEGVHEQAAEAVRDALASARRRLPRLPLELAAALLLRDR